VLLPAPRENKDNHGGEDEGRTATYCAGDDSYAASAFAVGITVNAAGAISADATRAVLLAKRFQLVRAISSVHATVADNVARHTTAEMWRSETGAPAGTSGARRLMMPRQRLGSPWDPSRQCATPPRTDTCRGRAE